MTTPTLIKWPSKSRPSLMARNFALWNARPEDVRFLISLDSDDDSLPAYRDVLYGHENVTVVEGTSAGKVNAINRDMDRAGEWDFLILASDDFSPQRPDYASYLRGVLFDAFPDGDGVVQIPDGRRTDGLNTIPILGRAYFQRDGYIYRPRNAQGADGYVSVFCDDEFTAVSQMRNRVVVLDEVVCRHNWIGEESPDKLHLRNESFYMEDAQIFQDRKLRGFPA